MGKKGGAQVTGDCVSLAVTVHGLDESLPTSNVQICRHIAQRKLQDLCLEVPDLGSESIPVQLADQAQRAEDNDLRWIAASDDPKLAETLGGNFGDAAE